MPKTNMTFFFGSDNPLSNWHPAKFVVKNIEFANVEQFMMFCKAMLFKDKETAAKIMAAKTPKEQKALGRAVRGFDEAMWLEKREMYVERGCLAKFSQNPSMLKFLLATEGTELVEASPYDRIWGVGLAAHDPRILDKKNWLGSNLLGIVLERARAKLLAAKLAEGHSGAPSLPDDSQSGSIPLILSSGPAFHEDGTRPVNGEVFVFGSNLAGRHGLGSAKAALEHFGAVYGQGAGRQGSAYGIPTKDGRRGTPSLRDPKATLALPAIKASIDEFLDYARAHPSTNFFVVRLGCDLAAHKDADIAPMFKGAPSNCSFPEPWRAYIQGASPRAEQTGAATRSMP